jgi:hypothetical protein
MLILSPKLVLLSALDLMLLLVLRVRTSAGTGFSSAEGAVLVMTESLYVTLLLAGALKQVQPIALGQPVSIPNPNSNLDPTTI